VRSVAGAVGLVLLVCTPVVWAGNFRLAKVVEVRDASQSGASVAANNSVGTADAAPALVGGVVPRCEVTVALDGVRYSAIYPVDKHFRPTDFAPGEQIQARVAGNKLILQRLDGKEMKAKIVSRGPVE